MKRQLNGAILIVNNGKYCQNANGSWVIVHVNIANNSQDITNTNKTGPILFCYYDKVFHTMFILCFLFMEENKVYIF